MDDATTIDFGRIAEELGLRRDQVVQVAALLDEGNTVPFITRYRKEQTGNLDEDQIRRIQHRVHVLRQLAERAQTILRLIDAQGQLTPALRQAILEAESLKRLEDLYLPYRPKRRSRATRARDRGLGPLAERIWSGEVSPGTLSAAAQEYVDPVNALPDVEAVLHGAADIIAEQISEDADVRETCRRIAWRTGRLSVSATQAGRENGQEYRNYFGYSEAVTRIPPHRCLALNRGEKQKALRVKFSWEDEQVRSAVAGHYRLASHRFADFLNRCVADALNRLVQPSLEREIRRELTDRAEAHAVGVFARNLRSLLLGPPLPGQRVVAIDPGFRTGCKIAALDELGHCLDTEVIYVTGSAEKKASARAKLAEFMQRHDCELVAIGNGTACRETEELVAAMISEHLPQARYTIVNEAGASIYSTSTVARGELPDYDATARGTISIGRRLQDPLSELVKIDPQHIGVGLYQHDVNPKRLQASLDEVVESCVNYVGVDLNTASLPLLRRVSGFNQLIARRVVERRDRHGRFRNRRELLDVPGIGEATFTQAAGFLKIADGDEPLDRTWIHPESYQAARAVLARLSLSPEQLETAPDRAEWRQRISGLDPEALARELKVGLPTFRDILEALSRPGRDPRTDLPRPVFRQDVLKLDDLTAGMKLTGRALNVVDFGVFVDIGLKDSGLVHISQMSEGYVRSPHEAVSVGDVLTVWVLGVDRERRRVSLTMIDPEKVPPPSGRDHESNSETRQSGKRQTASRNPQTRRRGRGPPRSRPRKPKRPAPPLSDEKLAGEQPLQGFDELKELWRKHRSP